MSESVRQSKISSLRVAAVAVFVLALFGAVSRVEATTLIPVDVAQLSDQAELVFTGTAIQSRVVRSKDGDPYTFVTFAVHDVLKGWTMERQLALRFSGGETEEGALTLEGMPQFEQGETYLLFVRGNGSLLCPVLGWWQGQFRFSSEAGSGKRILVDSAGVPLAGIAEGHFKKVERTDRHAAEREMTVVSEQGVHVELQEDAQNDSATPDAAQVIGQVRSFIAGRATAATFRPGRRVDSARPEDLPAHRAVAAAHQQ